MFVALPSYPRQALITVRTSAGQMTSWWGWTGHFLHRCLLYAENKGSHCAQTAPVENSEAPGSDTVEPAAARATQAPRLSSQLCSAPLLIAESWPEWGEDFYWAKDTGSQPLVLISDWTVANLPAASAPHRDYSTSITHSGLFSTNVTCHFLSRWYAVYFTVSSSLCLSTLYISSTASFDSLRGQKGGLHSFFRKTVVTFPLQMYIKLCQYSANVTVFSLHLKKIK